MKPISLVDLLMTEWDLPKGNKKLRRCMRQALAELLAESQLQLRRNPKLQVVVLPESSFSVWAYFPAHRKRWIVRRFGIELKPGSRVILVISLKDVQEQPATRTIAELRHHLGHTLLYLRRPRSRNECRDAEREWRASVVTQSPKRS